VTQCLVLGVGVYALASCGPWAAVSAVARAEGGGGSWSWVGSCGRGRSKHTCNHRIRINPFSQMN